ncbi:leucine dehydrogenase [Paenarthrobacter nicotinovorans]|uniref:Leucine dehydrogenase n=1 Tax=Paenarthrobacter nicotinovorans TaxID=29320 RepID=A0ABT9TRQ0_PAENI|nr:Glu/Leu/Phe/Val dehydrogenase dimerization domain-containing protein [Paenarthrobacter nicotinovorans]MDQ0104363.1 leucine dehydrogenase [Paenarthrobacter nicotinovorans]
MSHAEGKSKLFEHEDVRMARGQRSGLQIVVARHSTILGPALGGCRVWGYESDAAALEDALRLSAGMTAKNALAGLPLGGGKAVIRLEPRQVLDQEQRIAAFSDLGDLVESFGGSYITAGDVGTTPYDMAVVATRTRHVVGLREEGGGLGDPGAYTARGVLSAIDATLQRLGLPGRSGRRFTVVGLGQVGGRIARELSSSGGKVTVGDIAPAKRTLADEIGANWADPAIAHRIPTDIFVPAGVGGMLTDTVITELDARAVVGPANNQLAQPDLDRLLANRGILYAPDYLVNAGGVIYLGAPDRGTIETRIDSIGDTVAEIFDRAVTAADQIVEERINASVA